MLKFPKLGSLPEVYRDLRRAIPILSMQGLDTGVISDSTSVDCVRCECCVKAGLAVTGGIHYTV